MENFSRTPTGRPRRSDLNQAIATALTRQAGSISQPQLKALGLDSRAIDTRVRNGQLVPRLAPKPRYVNGRARRQRSPMTTRVFTSHGGQMSVDTRRWVGILSGPSGSRLGHLSVCWLMGVDEPLGFQPVHVVHLGAAWDAPAGVVAHRTTKLPGRDQAELKGLPSTTLSRALIDAAADVSPYRLDDMLDTAVRIKAYDGVDLLRVIKDRPTIAGARHLAAAISRLDDKTGSFRSTFERRTTRLAERSSRIPPLVVNVLVDGFRPDLRVVGARAIIECDGCDYHRSPAQIEADDRREEILRARGYVFLRLRWEQVVYQEEATLALIERFVLANLAPPISR